VSLTRLRRRLKAELWKRSGQRPGAYGWNAARWFAIERATAGRPDERYGWNDAGIDERVVEYGWLFDRVRSVSALGRVLDAGSVMNYRPVIDAWRRPERPPLSIVTLGYEGQAYVSSDVRYEFADLRLLPYRDEWFSTVLCFSTIEHVGLDTSIYGYRAEGGDAGRESVRAMDELQRVTAHGGTLLLSVPFGARSNRGWLRVFDADDLDQLITLPGWRDVRTRFFRATRDGWREVAAKSAASAGYNEPPNRPGQRTAPPWVAAAEAVALVEMVRV
jgi:SAM-dependent methyltransferase